MQPILSIVTGTWNRLPYLKKMLESVARSIPAGIAWEAVIVDGGSTDGTLEWCRQQHVRLIEHGELRGAIPAFCDGARQAAGEYVILANDDITFVGDSILRALAYLERTPKCGAVAFEDNRPAPGYPPSIYKTQLMNAVKDGKGTAVTYAQVGMYRRWLGDLCGWWGDGDPVMQQARTYGGDNYLSARIWEYGYSVDAVEGCRVDDAVAPDALRQQNYQHEQQNRGSAYHKRYPHGPTLPGAPLPPNPQREQMRILYLPLYEPGWGKYKRGLREALKRVGLVVEWDYLNDPDSLEALVASWQPHLLLTQFHDATSVAAHQLAAARRRCPPMVVANWNGDVYPEALLAPAMLDVLRHVDVQLVVNADVLAAYETVGIHSVYWQISFEPVGSLPRVPKHDVVFLGNAYSEQRKALETVLRSMDGVNVGIYGSGWQQAEGNTLYNFETGAALYRSAKIAIGDNQWPDKGFVSNRLFEALGNGAFLLHQAVPGLNELTSLQDGVHYVAWSDFDDLRAKIEYYLAHEAERDAIAEDGEFSAHTNHSFDARVRELFERILPGIKHRDTA